LTEWLIIGGLMDYSEEAQYPLLDTGATNWGPVLNAIFEAIDAGREFNLVAGENIAQYNAICMKADGKMWKAKADSLDTMFFIGIAPEAVTLGLSGKLRWNGWIENVGWAWTVGAPLYLSVSSAGALTETQPSTNALPIAIAKTATKIVITPSIPLPPKTSWKDVSALSGVGFTDWSLTTDGLNAVASGKLAIFNVPYEANSILSRLRVKYSGSDVDTGVKVTLRKRDESGITTTYTAIGAQQTMHNSGAAVTIYDFANETMVANFSYEMAVESDIVSGGSTILYTVGVETTKREK
jgi:hypothetical protein